ncbi:MAG TPA: DUF72 domain-containing protein [bacterium]|jgi:uncharacterized protein YecE (DUF72 family)
MQPGTIDIGTSGWKFDDWAGTFYPLRVPQTKWLEYYAARFPIGELNSTYYRIAPTSVYEAIARKTPPQFRLFAKVHADVTHKRENPETSLRNLLIALDPLQSDGKLLGLLAQFPGNFRYVPESVDYLKSLRDLCKGIRLCVEFRHRSWAGDEALQQIRELDLTWVSPDEPPLPDLMPRRFVATSDILYVRLHGRNAAAWYNREAGDRYDYEYSTEELTEIGREILAAEAPARRGYVLFNNCYVGKAPRNALWLKNYYAALLETGGDQEPSDGFTLSAH